MKLESELILDLSDDLRNQGLSSAQIFTLCRKITVTMLSKQQRQIYDELDKYEFCAVDVKYLSHATGLDSKNISSQLNQMSKNTNLIGVVKSINKKFKYYKKSFNYEEIQD